MAPIGDADNANISNRIATSRASATGRVGTILMGTTLHNIPTPKLPHNSREANAHAVPGGFGGAERLSPGYDQEAVGGEMKNPSTGAMSMKASIPMTGHLQGTWSQSNHRFNLFVDPYFHVREGIFFPQHAAGSSVPLCEPPGYHQVSPAFNQPGFSTSDYMPGSPDKDPYSPQEKYGRAYETSENTRSVLSPGPQTQQPESPYFDEPPSHSDLTHSGRHYSVGYSSTQPHNPDWCPGNTPDNYYEGSFRDPHYSHEARSHSPDLETQNIPARPLGDGIQPPFSEVFSHLNRSLVVEPGQPSTSGEASYFAPGGVLSSTCLPPVRRNSAQQPPQQPSQGAFNSAPDHGNFPGCFVLIPIDVGQAGDSSGVSSPQETLKKEKQKRKPMLEEDRAAVKQNRIHGVCYRCKTFKERCRGGFPCERCQALPFWQPLCVTMQLVDKKVFSRGLYKAQGAQQRENIQEWLERTSIVLISNGFPPTLQILVNEYVSNDTSLLQNVLWRGNTQSGFTRISSMPFGVLPANEPVALIPHFDGYLNDLIPLLISQLCSGGHEKVFIDTMTAAYRYNRRSTEGGSIILLALRIWAAQFMFFKHPWRLDPRTDSDSALGMTVITSKGSASSGITPLPILLNQQLDSLIERKIADLEIQFLTELHTRMFLKRPPGEWFGIYLAVFVFFTALEEDTWNLETWNRGVKSTAISSTGDPIEWPLNESPEALIDKNMRLVDILVAHFRSVSPKSHVPPFPPEGKKVEGEEMARREQQEIDYMDALVAEVNRRGDTLKSRRVSAFDPDKFNSLNMKYSCRLLIATD